MYAPLETVLYVFLSFCTASSHTTTLISSLIACLQRQGITEESLLLPSGNTLQLSWP